MLHECEQRFDVTENLEHFYVLGGSKQGLEVASMRGEKKYVCSKSRAPSFCFMRRIDTVYLAMKQSGR